MKARFLHVYLEKAPGVDDAQVAEQMNKAKDWFRYDDKCWVVYSTSGLIAWKKRIEALAGKDGEYFICELHIDKRVGYMAKAFWKWIEKLRPEPVATP